MEYRVETPVIEQTHRCPRAHACLSGGDGELCRILAVLEEGADTHFIYCRNDTPCVYRETDGERLSCSCPIRIRIFQRYGV